MNTAEPNPARVLRRHLQQATQVSPTVRRGGQDHNRRVDDIWAEVFGVTQTTSGEFARRMAGLIDLSAETRMQVAVVVPEILDTVDRRLSKFEGYLLRDLARENFSQHWADIDGQGVSDLLHVVAPQLDSAESVGLRVTDVGALLERIEGLIDDLNASDLEENLKRRALSDLEHLLSYLESAPTRSTGQLVLLIEAVLGRITGSPEIVAQLMKNPAGKAALAAWTALLLVSSGSDPSAELGLPPPDPNIVVICESNVYEQAALPPAGGPIAELEPPPAVESEDD